MPTLLSAQYATFQFYSTKDGLSGSHTSYVRQDYKGFIWVNNDSKLFRLDGRRFELIEPPAEVPGSNEKLEMGEFYQDSLLLAMGESHLFFLNIDTKQWRSYPLPSQRNSDLLITFLRNQSEKEVKILTYLLQKDKIEIWTFQDGVFVQDKRPEITCPKEHSFQVGLDEEVYIYNAYQNGKDANLKIYYPEKEEPLTVWLDEFAIEGHIAHVFTDKKGQLYLSVIRDLTIVNDRAYYKFNYFSLDLDSKKVESLPVNRFMTKRELFTGEFMPIKNGDIWIQGDGNHMYFYDASQDTLFNYSANVKSIITNNNTLFGLYEDNNGTIWTGSNLGLLKVSITEAKIEKYFSEPNILCAGGGNCSFRGLTETEDGEIFASYYNGIVSFDPKTGVINDYIQPKNFSLPLPSDLIVEENKLILNNGTFLDLKTGMLLDIKGIKADLSNEEGFFTKDNQGEIWWLFLDELFQLDKNSDEWKWNKRLLLPQKGLFKNEALHHGKYSGQLLIGTKGSLLIYNPETEQREWIDFDLPALGKLRVLAIEELGKNDIWIATDKGLVHLDRVTKDRKRYTIKDGLPNDFICGMLAEGDSCLWLSTNHGLSRFHIASQSFVNFFEEDGISFNEFNRKSFFKGKDGRMYFGGLRGINAFYPKELEASFRNENQSAQVSLSSYEYVDEKKDTTFRKILFPKNAAIDVSYHHRSFTFEYILTDFSQPDGVSYSYRMKGYEDTWSTPSKFNFTRFSSLPPGNYTFEVKAKDSRGFWHPNQLSVQVNVYPAWWASNIAYLIYALIIGAIIYAIFTFLKRRWQLQNTLKTEQAEATRLKELDSFKTKLYTNLTHEFRTPLTVILGMTDQIKKQPDKYLDKGTQLIKSNGQSLLRLVNQLLDLSKLENKSFKLNLEHGNFASYLRYMTESFQTFANSQNISLRFFSTHEDLEMDFDPEQIKQVITNLISNAIKFTPNGGEVNVRLSIKETSDHPLAIIKISDTGIGIAEKDLPNIFDRFYQVDGSTTREGEGTGIGLAHTLELIKLMDGDISVESKFGKGTEFLVQLPILKDAAVKKHELQNESLTSSTSIELEKNTLSINVANTINHIREDRKEDTPRLLIIEDNPDVVAYLKTCLEDTFQLDIALNGLIGINKAIDHVPDLILSDVMMPQKDGYEVCDTLKNDERTSHIPIILLTAKADAASKIAGLRRGADAYLPKPFDKEELIVRLQQLFERQKRMIRFFKKQFEITTSFEDPSKQQKDEAIQIEDAFVQKVRKIVQENYEDDTFALPQLCQKIGMSRSQLYRKMKALADTSPSDFIRNYRLQQAKNLLETTDLNVSEVAWQVGFKDLTHFSRSFHSTFGFLPSATNK